MAKKNATKDCVALLFKLRAFVFPVCLLIFFVITRELKKEVILIN